MIVLVLVGVPGAGKSTLSKRFAAFGWRHINQDELGDTQACEDALRAALRVGQNVVIDRCNINDTQRAHWVRLAHECGASRVALQLLLPLELCKQRARCRVGHPNLGAHNCDEVIDRFTHDFVAPTPQEGFGRVITARSSEEAEQALELLLAEAGSTAPPQQQQPQQQQQLQQQQMQQQLQQHMLQQQQQQQMLQQQLQQQMLQQQQQQQLQQMYYYANGYAGGFQQQQQLLFQQQQQQLYGGYGGWNGQCAGGQYGSTAQYGNGYSAAQGYGSAYTAVVPQHSTQAYPNGGAYDTGHAAAWPATAAAHLPTGPNGYPATAMGQGGGSISGGAMQGAGAAPSVDSGGGGQVSGVPHPHCPVQPLPQQSQQEPPQRQWHHQHQFSQAQEQQQDQRGGESAAYSHGSGNGNGHASGHDHVAGAWREHYGGGAGRQRKQEWAARDPTQRDVLQRLRREFADPSSSTPYDAPAEPDAPTDPRVIILFDLNGTLTCHTSVRNAKGVTKLRPGTEHLMQLRERFRLGIYTSSTLRTVQTAMGLLEGVAGGELFERGLVLHRDHTKPAPAGHVDAGGNAWDTLKPLGRYFSRLDRVVLVDDDSYKSIAGEEANMLVVPCWQENDADCPVLRVMCELLMARAAASEAQPEAPSEGAEADTDVRRWTAALSDEIREAAAAAAATSTSSPVDEARGGEDGGGNDEDVEGDGGPRGEPRPAKLLRAANGVAVEIAL